MVLRLGSSGTSLKFVKCLATNSRLIALAIPRENLISTLQNSMQENANFLFDCFDRDNKGWLNKYDFFRFLYELGRHEEYEGQFDSCYDYVIGSSDGELTMDLFIIGVYELYANDFFPPGFNSVNKIDPKKSAYFHIFEQIVRDYGDDYAALEEYQEKVDSAVESPVPTKKNKIDISKFMANMESPSVIRKPGLSELEGISSRAAALRAKFSGQQDEDEKKSSIDKVKIQPLGASKLRDRFLAAAAASSEGSDPNKSPSVGPRRPGKIGQKFLEAISSTGGNEKHEVSQNTRANPGKLRVSFIQKMESIETETPVASRKEPIALGGNITMARAKFLDGLREESSETRSRRIDVDLKVRAKEIRARFEQAAKNDDANTTSNNSAASTKVNSELRNFQFSPKLVRTQFENASMESLNAASNSSLSRKPPKFEVHIPDPVPTASRTLTISRSNLTDNGSIGSSQLSIHSTTNPRWGAGKVTEMKKSIDTLQRPANLAFKPKSRSNLSMNRLDAQDSELKEENYSVGSQNDITKSQSTQPRNTPDALDETGEVKSQPDWIKTLKDRKKSADIDSENEGGSGWLRSLTAKEVSPSE